MGVDPSVHVLAHLMNVFGGWVALPKVEFLILAYT